MFRELVAFAQAQAKTTARRVAVSAACALIAGLFALFAAAGLFAALFYWIEPQLGPIAAALICAASAVVLAIGALLPLMLKRPRPVPPPPQAALPQFIALMVKTAPNLAPRQLIVTAALIGVALTLSARRNKK
jgi:Putative Actinobacterial Holin-X, holin superfamily III